MNYIEQELAKRRGKNIDVTDKVENDLKRAEDELYKVPEHLKVSDIHTCFSSSFPFQWIHLSKSSCLGGVSLTVTVKQELD